MKIMFSCDSNDSTSGYVLQRIVCEWRLHSQHIPYNVTPFILISLHLIQFTLCLILEENTETWLESTSHGYI